MLLRVAMLTASLGGWSIASPASAEPEKVKLWLSVEETADVPARGLTRADLQVVAGGSRIASEQIELRSPNERAAGEPARVAIYFDLALARSSTLRTAAEALAGLAERLSELGEVEVVIADQEPQGELATREVAALKQRLATATAQLEGGARLLEVRSTVFDELEKLAPGGGKEGTAKPGAKEAAAVVARGIERERELLRTRLDLLITWAAQRPADRPQALFWVQDGFDLDPLAFYRASLLDEVARELSADSAFEEMAQETARALAASGWTVVPVTLRPEVEIPKAVQPTAILLADPMDPLGQDPPPGGLGIKIRPNRVAKWWRERRGEEGSPKPDFADPAAALTLVAETTGGEAVTSPEALDAAVRRLFEGYELAFVPPPGEGGERALEVRSLRSGLKLRARRFWSHVTPESVTAARLRRLLAGDELTAPLELEALLRLDPPRATLPTTVEVELLIGFGDPETGDVPDRTDLANATVAITLAADAAGKPAPRASRVLAPQDLRTFRSWHHRFTAELPAGASDLAMTVELIGTGLWGGARVEGVVIEPEDRGKDLLVPVKLPASR